VTKPDPSASEFSISPDIKREKRSLSLYGHRTSVALETPFWDVLDKAALAKDMSLAGLLCALDDARIAARSEHGLAAYLRIWAMSQMRAPE
jgi:predicted DNA-binding ribbon-helix-helix protein